MEYKNLHIGIKSRATKLCRPCRFPVRQKFKLSEFIHKENILYFARTLWYQKWCTMAIDKHPEKCLYPIKWSYPNICPHTGDKIKAVILNQNKKIHWPQKHQLQKEQLITLKHFFQTP